MIGDELAAALPELRAHAESRMRGTCTIERPGHQVTDPDGNVTRASTQIYPDPGWSAGHKHRHGPCYVRYPGIAFERNADLQGVSIAQSRVLVRIPFGVLVRPDDVVTITSDPDNPQLAGAVYRVASIDDQSQATAQRLVCEDNQSGVRT